MHLEVGLCKLETTFCVNFEQQRFKISVYMAAVHCHCSERVALSAWKPEKALLSNPYKIVYCIRPNFRGAQFSWIAFSKHFVETIFADKEFRV